MRRLIWPERQLQWLNEWFSASGVKFGNVKNSDVDRTTISGVALAEASSLEVVAGHREEAVGHPVVAVAGLPAGLPQGEAGAGAAAEAGLGLDDPDGDLTRWKLAEPHPP
jgi:hypothetical protein